jgi:hypothetical protein
MPHRPNGRPKWVEMIGRILLAIPMLFGVSYAQADWDIGGGLEHYQWVEYPVGVKGTPKEGGPRFALFLNWAQEAEHGLQFAWRAKLYGGTVNYDTFFINNGAPVSTKADYLGISNEAQLFYRDHLGGYQLDYLGGLGLDYWRRTIRNTGFNQIEDYSATFVRAGLRLSKSRREAGLHGEFGIKYPLGIRENAYLTSLGYTSNPQISPKGLVSGYAEIGYRINATFDVVGYYDSWRLGRSENVIAYDAAGTAWLIHQPKSNMDALGIKLLVSF